MRRWIAEKGNYDPSPSAEELDDLNYWHAARIMNVYDVVLAEHPMRDALVARTLYYDSLMKELAGIKISKD